jgi:integrase
MPKKVDRSKWVLLDHGRDQKGWLEQAGKFLYGAFRARWRMPNGTERDYRERVKLGVPSMGLKAAERLLITKIGEFFDTHLTASGLQSKATPDATFSWLLEKVKEIRQADWKLNTARINEMYLKILRDKLGHVPIRDFGTVEMQDYLRGWLQELASKNLSRSYVQHVLIYLRAALNEAVKRQLVHFNYASELKVPARLKEVDQRVLSEEQVATLIKHLRACGQRRDALIVTIFYTCALRPGELFALRWNDWGEDRPAQLRIDEAFGKSGLDTPKTAQSRGHVYLPPAVQSELKAWKDWCGDVRPDAWVFTSKRGTPIAYDNYLERTLQPAATACGIGEITHQMLRRTFSTVAVDGGASPKDIQGQMRHTQASMSMYYAKAIPKSVAEEVDKLTDRLLEKPARKQAAGRK